MSRLKESASGWKNSHNDDSDGQKSGKAAKARPAPGSGGANPAWAEGRRHPACEGANPAQDAAIHHFTGPCEVLAGPGSGKTFVLIQRILFLIRDKGVAPSSILALTFSRASAIEMQRRFHGLTRPEQYPVVFGTFHSVFYRILRESSDHSITLITNARQRGLLNSLILRYLQHTPSAEEVTSLSSLISKTKATGRYPAEGSGEALSNFRSLFRDYTAYLTENDLIDFDDMIERCRLLLRRSPEILERWQRRFCFLLVDEFQDINASQFEILRLLAGEKGNLFVVGDDDQSIYGFRGSDPSYMLRFQEIYPGAPKIILNINYRCRGEISRRALCVIKENTVRMDKEVQSYRPGEHCVHLMEFEDEERQYDALVRMLSELKDAAIGRTAVIVRSHMQMQGLRSFLEKNGIPYQERGRGKKESAFQDRRAGEEIRVLLGYLRLAEEFSQDTLTREHLFAVMNHPERYLLRKDFGKETYSEEELLLLYPRGSREAAQLRRLCRDLYVMQHLSPVRALRYLEEEIGVKPQTRGLSGTLESLALECRDLTQFRQRLEREKLSIPAGTADQNAEKNAIQILTMHACKGLEFDTVFLPDLNEGVLPSRRAQSPESIEEERRLFYVSMTRARDQLYLMYLRGDRENPRLPCRFLHALGVKDWVS